MNNVFEISSLVITLAAACSYINFKYVRLPPTIGIMLMSLVGSLLLAALGHAWPPLHDHVAKLMAQIDFRQIVLHGMLAFLLFAGSLHLSVEHLRQERDVVSILAIAGTALSSVLVSGLIWLVLRGVGLHLPLSYCLLFGALISPTDPIAVLGVMKHVHAPKALEAQLAGESLFNDGIGVVIFLTALNAVVAAARPSWAHLILTLFTQVLGGIVLGCAVGALIYHLLKRIENYQVEVLLTLAAAAGGFTLAEAVHVSAPIATVVCGLLVGSRGRAHAMSSKTREHLDMFWELLDDILNAVLFLLIGLQMLVTHLTWPLVVAGLLSIVITLACRFLSVAGGVALVERWRSVPAGTVTVLTWGGLRGGLSVAMALSLPHNSHSDVVLAMTYAVVIFSVAVQGLTIGQVIKKATAPRQVQVAV